MGYHDISIQGSDTASDLMYAIRKAVAKADEPGSVLLDLLRKEIPVDHGSYNTPGVVNVALVLTDPYTERFRAQPWFPGFAAEVGVFMEKMILVCQHVEWTSEDSKQTHIRAYRDLADRLWAMSDRPDGAREFAAELSDDFERMLKEM